MNRQWLGRVIIWILLICLSILMLINIFVLLKDRDMLLRKNQDLATEILEKGNSIKQLKHAIDQIDEEMASLKQIVPSDGKDGIDGKRGKDGKDGEPGENGKDGHPGINGSDGIDGKTPYIRCNKEANRWEVRYSKFESWSTLGGEEVRCSV